MATELEGVVERLAAIGDELADLALERLARASESLRSGEGPDPQVIAEERRITRARRAIERATSLLSDPHR
ncbi:MAG: hypothetical protein ACYCVN_12675 [Acidimicrobiales bacterium]